MKPSYAVPIRALHPWPVTKRSLLWCGNWYSRLEEILIRERAEMPAEPWMQIMQNLYYNRFYRKASHSLTNLPPKTLNTITFLDKRLPLAELQDPRIAPVVSP